MHCVKETESESSAVDKASVSKAWACGAIATRLTLEQLAAVGLAGLEFDRDDVTERLVQELDGDSLLGGRGGS